MPKRPATTQITLTEFVDFVLKAGTPKLTVVRNAAKRREKPYDPKTDYYKVIRDGIAQFHETGEDPEYLDELVEAASKKKHDAYKQIVKGYRKFLGRKKVAWVKPKRSIWAFEDLEVAINPELHLKIGDEKHLIKMYFKDLAPEKRQLDVIVHLMQLSLGKMNSLEPHGMLDVRRGKMHSSSSFNPTLTPLLEGEAMSFATIYKSL